MFRVTIMFLFMRFIGMKPAIALRFVGYSQRNLTRGRTLWRTASILDARRLMKNSASFSTGSEVGYYYTAIETSAKLPLRHASKVEQAAPKTRKPRVRKVAAEGIPAVAPAAGEGTDGHIGEPRRPAKLDLVEAITQQSQTL